MSIEHTGQVSQVDPRVATQIHEVTQRIDGQRIVGNLLQLAAIGGEIVEPSDDHPVRIATNRLALSPEDTQARREFFKPRMQQAGMDILDDHPFALTGILPGRNRDLAPLVVWSHIDTVPDGDIYDGVLGVEGALTTIEIMQALKIRPERDIREIILTGEESSGYGIALFGSRGLTHGLTSDELDSRKVGQPSIREVLGKKAASRVMVPVFGPDVRTQQPIPYAVVELHVEQDDKLIKGGFDLGVVDRIAAPVRYQATIGETSLPCDGETYAHERYFRLTAHGSPDHSGATPMGAEHRADGLLETARALGGLLEERDGQPPVAINSIEVRKGAMNKVPGDTVTTLRVVSNSRRAFEDGCEDLKAALEQRSAQLKDSSAKFPPEPFELAEIGSTEAGAFFAVPEMAARYRAAFGLIESVNRAATERRQENVVGTVGSLTTLADGTLSLEVDIRGIEQASRDDLVGQVQRDLLSPAFGELSLGDIRPGSGEAPVAMDPDLVEKALDTIDRFEIGTAKQMFSAAGHDTQNAARAGFPSIMLFCQSKKGIAHDPDAYTSPANIQIGVQALGALMLRLANET